MTLKGFWYAMFFLSLLLIVVAGFADHPVLLLLCLATAFIVRVKGNKVLFKAFNERRTEKMKRLKAQKGPLTK